MKIAVGIILLLAMVGAVSLAIVTIDFIYTVITKLRKEDGEFDERISDPET